MMMMVMMIKILYSQIDGVFFAFPSVQKIFTVPSTAEQAKIPFARVNHAKYMVTDSVVYIGTLDFF